MKFLVSSMTAGILLTGCGMVPVNTPAGMPVAPVGKSVTSMPMNSASAMADMSSCAASMSLMHDATMSAMMTGSMASGSMMSGSMMSMMNMMAGSETGGGMPAPLKTDSGSAHETHH